jgi:hypothetical protein
MVVPFAWVQLLPSSLQLPAKKLSIYPGSGDRCVCLFQKFKSPASSGRESEDAGLLRLLAKWMTEGQRREKDRTLLLLTPISKATCKDQNCGKSSPPP